MRHFIFIIVKYDYKGSKLPRKIGGRRKRQEVTEMWCPLNVEKRASKAQENGENVRNKNRAYSHAFSSLKEFQTMLKIQFLSKK